MMNSIHVAWRRMYNPENKKDFFLFFYYFTSSFKDHLIGTFRTICRTCRNYFQLFFFLDNLLSCLLRWPSFISAHHLKLSQIRRNLWVFALGLFKIHAPHICTYILSHYAIFNTNVTPFYEQPKTKLDFGVTQIMVVS